MINLARPKDLNAITNSIIIRGLQERERDPEVECDSSLAKFTRGRCSVVYQQSAAEDAAKSADCVCGIPRRGVGDF